MGGGVQVGTCGDDKQVYYVLVYHLCPSKFTCFIEEENKIKFYNLVHW